MREDERGWERMGGDSSYGRRELSRRGDGKSSLKPHRKHPKMLFVGIYVIECRSMAHYHAIALFDHTTSRIRSTGTDVMRRLYSASRKLHTKN